MSSAVPIRVEFVYPACRNVMRTAASALVTSCNVNIDVYGKGTVFKAYHMF